MRLLFLVPLLLAGCGSAPQMQTKPSEKLTTMEVQEARAPAAMEMPAPADVAAAPPGIDGGAQAPAAPGQPAPIAVSVPQMAYSYGYIFRLPEAAVSKVQDRHVALCDSLGQAKCQVLSMRSAGGDEDAGSGSLKLRVASALARNFGARLGEASAAAGGRTVSSTIAAEDVSKDIVDTEARLRQRELLVARLTEILRMRQGKVAELVEAERSVAAAQEEIDQARGWLTELRGRVAMATIEIAYQPIAAGPAAATGGLGDSVTQSGSAFVAGLSGILQLLIFLAPWAVLLGVLALVGRRMWPRVRAWRPGGGIAGD